MTDKAKKVLDILGVNVGEEFMIEGYGLADENTVYKFNEDLVLLYYYEGTWWRSFVTLNHILNNKAKIVKISESTKTNNMKRAIKKALAGMFTVNIIDEIVRKILKEVESGQDE